MRKKAIIIGAGPVGLSTAQQLLTKTDIIPIILEGSGDIEGLPASAANSISKMGVGFHRILSRLVWSFFTTKNSVPSCVELAHEIEEAGGRIFLHQLVYSTYAVGREVCAIHTINSCTGELTLFPGDYFFSTLPVGELKPLSFSTSTTYSNLFRIGNKKNYSQIFKTLS